MASNEFDESDPLEELLDQESQDQFGLPIFREHLDGEQSPLVLKNWTAQDFSNIYVRFQPHLLRHAKRYLTNHSQAEEVVQDAFLYLMTSLPEIDTETGALKLLKWKVRLLALDVISSNGRASFAPIDDQFDLEAKDSSIDQNLIQADEAAIVSLALAKLEPRQREALIAAIYEEKSTIAVSAQLGLNENATRQLIHRAKGAFKKALIGEAETRGLSVSQILSIAARKASQDAGKYVSAASALLLVIAISVGVIPNIGQSPENSPDTMAQDAGSGAGIDSSNEAATEVGAGNEADAPVRGAADAPAAIEGATVEAVTGQPESAAETGLTQTVSNARQAPATNRSTDSNDETSEPGTEAAEVNLLGTTDGVSARNAGFAFPFGFSAENRMMNLLIFSGAGLSAYVDLAAVDASGEFELSNPVIQFETDRGLTSTRIGDFATTSTTGAKGTTLSLVANDLILIDSYGASYSQQSVTNLTVTLVVELDRLGQPTGASIFAQ
jgi:RNA polymerase sigma-70 factor (ECF subfamily)